MRKKFFNKTTIVAISFFLLGLSFSSKGAEAGNVESIKGFFSNIISIFNNDKEVDLGHDPVSGESYRPLIIGSRTYIPVRALSEVLGKEVSWTQATNRIDIKDKEDENYHHLLEKYLQGQKQIEGLEEKMKRLESRLESKSTQIEDLSEMANYLNNQYYDYNNIRLYIYLSGNTKDINMKVFVDSRDNSKWNKLTGNDINKLIEEMLADIRFNFRDSVITGYVENDYSGKKVVDFQLEPRGDLLIEISDVKDLEDMAKLLNDKFKKFKGYDFEVKLYWDLDKIRADVFVLDTDWFELGDDNRHAYLKEVIYKEINREFPFEKIYGYIFDNYYPELYTNYVIQNFDFDYNGKLRLE